MKVTLSPSERRDWLRLARTELVGPVTFADLIKRFGGASRALSNLPDVFRNRHKGGQAAIPGLDEIEGELERGAASGARLLLSCDEDYPANLAALDTPPPVLWALGQTGELNRPAVAIVGARIASAAGQRFARTLAADLGAAGYVVVSGLARGIDGAAHEGALSTGTIAVLAGGIGDIYPREHEDLYAQIRDRGCIVSEARPGQVAQARDFPRRNRIISGLSSAIIVVEAELRSGSLITARIGAEQGREVLAVPGSPLDPRAKGCNDLIRQGAAICESVEDVLQALQGFGGFQAPGKAWLPEAETSADNMLNTVCEQVAGLLSPTPVSRDDLIRAVGGQAAPVLAALVELELAGRAEFSPGGGVAAT